MSKTIDKEIKEKQQMLTATHASLDLMLNTGTVTPAQRAKVRELQDRLEYRLLQHELALLTDKVDIYSQAVAVLSKK